MILIHDSDRCVNKKVRKMEEHIRQYIPSFNDHFRFVGPQLSVKTKPFSESGDRSCSVYRDGRVFSVMSGKIDTIFFAADEIVREIEKDG